MMSALASIAIELPDGPARASADEVVGGFAPLFAVLIVAALVGVVVILVLLWAHRHDGSCESRRHHRRGPLPRSKEPLPSPDEAGAPAGATE
jgi:hypothetical protein